MGQPTAATEAERLRIGNGGWVLYSSTVLPALWVRFAEAAGRLRLVELFIADDAGLDTHTLRQLPLGRIEAWVNGPDAADSVRAHLAVPGPDLRRAAAYFDTTFGARETHWVADMLAAQVKGSDVPQVPMPSRRARAPKPGWRPPPGLRGLAEATLRLDVPKSRSYGDDFYRQVATAYSALTRLGRAPGPTLAEANHVPVTTVHRWVKEARRRGFLPPGHAGKAG